MTESVPALQLGGDDNLNTQIATVLRFSVCTASGDAGPSEPFAAAADYLDDHPEVNVVATSW